MVVSRLILVFPAPTSRLEASEAPEPSEHFLMSVWRWSVKAALRGSRTGISFHHVISALAHADGEAPFIPIPNTYLSKPVFVPCTDNEACFIDVANTDSMDGDDSN